MRIVIDIDEDTYMDFKREVVAKVNTSEHIPYLHEVISVGIPLSDRPKGKWVKGHFDGLYHCSECDYIEDGKPNYCAGCGAKMRR